MARTSRLLSLTALLLLSGCSALDWFNFGSEPPPPAAPAAPSEPSPDWDCTRGENDLWNCEGANQVPPQARRPDASGAVPMAADDYVLQVGAFRQREGAVAEARRIGRPELLVLPTQRDGRDIFVLVLGVFPTEAEAAAAGDVYLEDNPQGTVWIRPASDVRSAIAATE